MTPAPLPGLCVLTVTYGDRIHLLKGMVDSVAAQGVRQVLVFGNGLAAPVRAALDALAAMARDTHGLILTQFHADTNLGPAIAYARLIEHATAARDQIDAILMLDDDNTLAPGCLDAMRTARAQGCTGALCAVRADRHYLVTAARTGRIEAPHPGEVFGTDLRKKPRRALARLRRSGPQPVPDYVPLPHAPYGGVCVPRSLLDTIAGPRPEFIIYADDYEYTSRLALSGLHLVPQALVEDQEQSWNATTEATAPQSNFRRLAFSNPDFRIYYAVRNAVHLDRARLAQGGTLWFWPNLIWLVLRVMGHAVPARRWANLRVLRHALRDAVQGRLGLHPDYPLP